MRRDEWLRQFRFGGIPQAEEEHEANYKGLQTLSAYGAMPSPNVAPAEVSPYWIPSGPSTPYQIAVNRQAPPQYEIAPGVPIDGLVPGTFVPPLGAGGFKIQIPGTDVEVEIPQDQQGICACLFAIFAQLQRQGNSWANEFARKLVARLGGVQQHARLPSHHQVPYSGIRNDSANPVPVTIFDSGFGPVHSFTVPDNFQGSLAKVGVDLDSPAGFADSAWRILRNNSRIPGIHDPSTGDIRFRLGTPENRYPLNIPLFPRDSVVIEARSLSLGSTYDASVVFESWLYPVRESTTDTDVRGSLVD